MEKLKVNKVFLARYADIDIATAINSILGEEKRYLTESYLRKYYTSTFYSVTFWEEAKKKGWTTGNTPEKYTLNVNGYQVELNNEKCEIKNFVKYGNVASVFYINGSDKNSFTEFLLSLPQIEAFYKQDVQFVNDNFVDVAKQIQKRRKNRNLNKALAEAFFSEKMKELGLNFKLEFSQIYGKLKVEVPENKKQVLYFNFTYSKQIDFANKFEFMRKTIELVRNAPVKIKIK